MTVLPFDTQCLSKLVQDVFYTGIPGPLVLSVTFPTTALAYMLLQGLSLYEETRAASAFIFVFIILIKFVNPVLSVRMATLFWLLILLFMFANGSIIPEKSAFNYF